ncbi:winged helix-turn-helix transcriptional regulator [Kribbella qitaiheensis]|uniref:Winged helix-turn-helix transcriptional regulator n=1 Tax=Kribbella qitaiheensis TaxID=1544730 RepID=A0A7G6X195_9ACTN|nr:winged helix-turn-helix domain-containing protein [Kribbella qitaiheensis]QNE20010.1 winged helix-turn-helix transcriptional regulator [Kribbella qitaiheensis]
MLRIIFTERDLNRVRLAGTPDPLWEITNSLHRLQTRRGRWAYARWYRSTQEALTDQILQRMVNDLLLPLFPRTAYFPDFLTPAAALEGLDAGIEAIHATPEARVTREFKTLALVHRAPTWGKRLAAGEMRTELGTALRTYHQKVIEPHHDSIEAAVEDDRVLRSRALMRGGVDQLLKSFWPLMRWQYPVLEVQYPYDRTLHLSGRGLLLSPSYFAWHYPVALADDELSPMLSYPLLHKADSDDPEQHRPSTAALLGTTRAAVLQATSEGLTTGEVAKRVGIGAPTASHHLTVLRDSGLIASQRHQKTVLHVLTPLGAALLRQNSR